MKKSPPFPGGFLHGVVRSLPNDEWADIWRPGHCSVHQRALLPIKFNAEGKDSVKLSEQIFINPDYDPKRSRSQTAPINWTRAMASVNGRSYPTVVYLNERMESSPQFRAIFKRLRWNPSCTSSQKKRTPIGNIRHSAPTSRAASEVHGFRDLISSSLQTPVHPRPLQTSWVSPCWSMGSCLPMPSDGRWNDWVFLIDQSVASPSMPSASNGSWASLSVSSATRFCLNT